MGDSVTPVPSAGLGLAEIIGIVILASFVINIGAFFLLRSCFRRVPKEHLEVDPGKLYLLMVPALGLLWNVFVFPGLALSYKSYFKSVEDESVGDCGEGLGWGYPACVMGAMLPKVGILAAVAAPVMLFLYFKRAFELKGKMPDPQLKSRGAANPAVAK